MVCVGGYLMQFLNIFRVYRCAEFRGPWRAPWNSGRPEYNGGLSQWPTEPSSLLHSAMESYSHRYTHTHTYIQVYITMYLPSESGCAELYQCGGVQVICNVLSTHTTDGRLCNVCCSLIWSLSLRGEVTWPVLKSCDNKRTLTNSHHMWAQYPGIPWGW